MISTTRAWINHSIPNSYIRLLPPPGHVQFNYHLYSKHP